MKVLFYIEPWIEKNRPEWKTGWIDAVLQPLYQALQGGTPKQFFFLLGDAQQEAAERLARQPATQTAIINQCELQQVFPDYLNASLAWYRADYSAAQLQAMQQLVQSKLAGFEPDIIISFMMPVPFLTQLFPQALPLHKEVGGFSRAPYPPAWHLDPCGMFAQNFVTRFADAIAAQPLNDAAQRFLAGFRQAFCTNLLRAKNPYTREQLLDGKPLRHLLLLPLQISDYIAFEGCCGFASQWAMLTHVLDSVRPDVGVVVTEHSDWERILTPAAKQYLRKTYPNFIHLDAFEDYEYPSQYLLTHVDAVATVSSSVGIQALLWRKPLCALGTSHINAMAQTDDLGALQAQLDAGTYADREALLYFLLTRYYFTGSQRYLWNSAWLDQRLTAWLQRYRAEGVTASFYDPVDTLEALLADYRALAHPHIPCTSRAIMQQQAAAQELQATNEALTAELAALKDSTSWRLTAPLRKIRNQKS